MKYKKDIKLNKDFVRVIIELIMIVLCVVLMTSTDGRFVINSEENAENSTELTSTDETAGQDTPVTYANKLYTIKDDEVTCIINSPEGLVQFAQDYDYLQNIQTVSIGLTEGSMNLTDSGFTGLGTATHPFSCKIEVSDNKPFTVKTDVPLFNYLSDKADLPQIAIIRTAENKTPLLANYVCPGGAGDVKTWTVSNEVYTDSANLPQTYYYAGVIGTMKENANVKLVIDNSASAITNMGNVGLACQEMEAGSNLTLDVTTVECSVSSESGYAGGLVGHAVDATVTVEKYVSSTGVLSGKNITGTVTAAAASGAAGGIFGYYENTQERELDLNGYDISCTLSGCNRGGFFGELKNAQNATNGTNGKMTITDSSFVDVQSIAAVKTKTTSDTAGVYGGLIGVYSSESSQSSLTIHNVNVNATVNNVENKSINMQHFGGVIGKINDSASYVKMDNVEVHATGSSNINNNNRYAFGGLVGYINGAFVEANQVKIISDDYSGGGIIGVMTGGVLRLSGTTDLSSAATTNNNSNIVKGQIVGTRGNQALIYAASDWTFKRSNTVSEYDDIGTWGAVLRLNDSTLAERDTTVADAPKHVLVVDYDLHTVTVKGAAVNISDLADFARLALNMQMNKGENVDNNALRFADTTNNSTVLLSSNSKINLNKNIDLKNTGITGLTRDDGKGVKGGENDTSAFFTGTFNGNFNKITLATGEAYGFRNDEELTSETLDLSETEGNTQTITAGNGGILRHHYNGLFAKTNGNATFNDLTVDGNIYSFCKDSSRYYYGGLSSYHKQDSFTAINVHSNVNFWHNGNGGDYHFIGGFIGGFNNGSGSITLKFAKKENDNSVNNTGCSTAAVIIDGSQSDNCKLICGGVIGDIPPRESVNITASDMTISAKVTNKSTNESKKIGGFIANIGNYNGTRSVGTVTLTNIVFNDAKVISSSNDNTNSDRSRCGALLGESWNNMDVTIGGSTQKGITVNNCIVKELDGGKAGDMAGLITAATGHWQVYDVTINSLTAIGGDVRSFGLFVNRGVHKDNDKEYALYLEFLKENAYTISGVNLDRLTSDYVFDEIIATCSGIYDDGSTILENDKCAVVSIHTSGGIITSGDSGLNTYHNQTGKAVRNPNARYYYNLDVIRNKVTNNAELSAPEKLLLWSVNTYAHNEIKSKFTGHYFSGASGSYDMTGYSYYPVDASGVTISGGSTFTFNNSEMESDTNAVGGRSTKVKDSQHYLMHFGLFKNVSGGLNISGDTNSVISLSGNIGSSENYCGAIVCGQLTGKDTGSSKISDISLNGIMVNGVDPDTVYAPLLVNSIPDNAAVEFSNISNTAAYKTNSITYAATSLIGNVGGTVSADNIDITFSKIVLDGRKEHGSGAHHSSLDAVYNTTQSIFTRATLLNSFIYTAGKSCTAVYDYTHGEDWAEDGAPIHHVTYGVEITGSKEYTKKNQQKKYIDSDYFTSPEADNASSEYDNFKDANLYLPYVALAYDPDNKTNNQHEIKVNHKNAANLIVGCGTYNDPYIITMAEQLELVANMLKSSPTLAKGVEINYIGKSNYTTWCAKNPTPTHKRYRWNGSKFAPVADDNTELTEGTITLETMANSLATAYYKVNGDITLPDTFIGIGKDKPFKGVIIGKVTTATTNENTTVTNYTTITNESTSPLIYNSTGSVVKDINVNVTADFSNALKGDANSKYITDGGTTEFYGGVFGIVNGGDNIIDNVSVTFIDNEGNNTAENINISPGTNPGNKAVGGYIGVVRYGGVFFRNMGKPERDCSGITAGVNNMFKSIENVSQSNEALWLYCNPIIGRVIDGFAVTETSASSSSAAMNNGTKNYSITTINRDAEKIAFSEVTSPKTGINSSTVTISDAQQLFILGCISMSGAGSAALGGDYPQKYYSYGNGQMTRHAEYSAIGTDETDSTKCTDYTDLVRQDSVALSSVPYIIYHYTPAQNDVYPARSITNNNCVFNINMDKGTYEMPAGFRGIGSLNNSSDDLKMYINCIQGNNSTIELNMSFYAYQKNYDQYYNVNKNLGETYVGLGLFNSLSQNNDKVTKSEDISSSNNVISKLTITGSINYEIYEKESSKKAADRGQVPFCCTGGLAGIAYSKNGTSTTRLNNVITDGLTINARYLTGGLIGTVRNGSIEMVGCNSKGLTLVNGVNSGGLIGYINSCKVTIDGNNGEFKFDSISTIEQSPSAWNGNEGHAGLIGTEDCSGKEIIVKNVNITGGRINTSSNSGKSFFVGSVIGCCKNGTISIDNVTVTNVNINDIKDSYDYCGGFIGGTKKDVRLLTIKNSKIKSTSNDNRCIINGSIISGGFVGYCGSDLLMDNCSIENYNLRAAHLNGSSDGIAVFVAKLEDSKTMRINNCKASECTLTATKSTGDKNYKPIGRIVGSAVKNVNVYGYNIVLYNIKIQLIDGNNIKEISSDHKYCGDIIGEMNNNSNATLVGVSMTQSSGIFAGKNAGNTINNSSITVIYSDYNGTCLTPSGEVTANGVFPYATASPRTKIGSNADTKVWTGDGPAGTYKKIIDEVGNDCGYKIIANDVTVFANYQDKAKTFNDKCSHVDNDFPILIINELDFTKITEMLNSYIHILTNDSTLDYTQDNDSLYKVEMTPYRLIDSGGKKIFSNQTTPTLKREGGNFKMTNQDYDSAHDQFTLIDIQYLDPSGEATDPVYHLYIPVYVEKLLNFNFKAGSLSGTTYNVDSYTDGNPVLENYGTPITTHITYSYLRTAEEWQNAINSGENLLKAYGKTVTIDNDVMPEGTNLVLVDKNNSNKAYYSTFAHALVYNDAEKKRYLYFNKFVASNGDSFVPVSFIDLVSHAADLKAEVNTSGTLEKCDENNTDEATVIINGEYYKPATPYSTTKYTVTVEPKDKTLNFSTDPLNVDEEYYISFFTKENNNEAAGMIRVELSCALRLDDTGMLPSHRNNMKKEEGKKEEGITHIILGDLYEQQFTFSTDTLSENDVDKGPIMMIDENDPKKSNNKINAHLETTISLKSGSASAVQTFLAAESIHLYHSFVIEATNTDENGSNKGIKGTPQVKYTYNVAGAEYPQDISNTENTIMVSGDSTGAFVDIKGYLANSNSVTITCDDLTITYPDSSSIISQFPLRKSVGQTSYGTLYSAVSNLAYTVDNIEHSSMSAVPDAASATNCLYYRENLTAATLSYNIPGFAPNDMTMLGINGRESNDRIDAIAYYNVQNITDVDMNNAEHIRFTLSLYQKDNSGGYNDNVDMDNYLERIRLYYEGIENDTGYGTPDNGEYTFTIAKSKLTPTEGLYEVKTSFDVKTGAEFENGYLTYANYKVMLKAELLDGEKNPIANTECSDYIIYTNAKICTEMLANAS